MYLSGSHWIYLRRTFYLLKRKQSSQYSPGLWFSVIFLLLIAPSCSVYSLCPICPPCGLSLFSFTLSPLRPPSTQLVFCFEPLLFIYRPPLSIFISSAVSFNYSSALSSSNIFFLFFSSSRDFQYTSLYIKLPNMRKQWTVVRTNVLASSCSAAMLLPLCMVINWQQICKCVTQLTAK